MASGLLAALSLVLLPSLAPPFGLHRGGAAARRTVPRASAGAAPRTFVFRRLSSAPDGPDGPAPLLLYLPGIDGSGLSGGTQWGRLSSELTIEALSLTPADRSTFDQLVRSICGYIAGMDPPRRVLLCGESTGAVFALGVALAQPRLVSALCLINPGTAYDGSPLSMVAPLLPRLPLQLYSISPSLVTPLLGKPGWFNPLVGLPADQRLPTGAAMVVDASRRLAEMLPPAALAWRLREQLGAGAAQVNRKLRSGGGPYPWEASTLLIASGRDVLLPSGRETARLLSILRGAKRRVLVGAGHAAMDDPALNLRLELTLSGVLGSLRPASASALPSVNPAPESPFEVWLQGMKRLFSPVFFSLNESASMLPGLQALPSLDGPTLLVGNHQLFG
jgi:pimeloyl-ACP methyl ester carboxylesterase